MKKLISLGLLAVIVFSLALTGYADQAPIEMEDVSAEPGQTVYLDICLTQPVAANAIGITFSCDESILQPMPSSSTWAYDGVLEDFDPLRDVGVWAAASSVELQGEIVTLAFNVLTDAAYFETEVSCTVVLKNDAEKVLEYTAQAVVKAVCDHAYGAWADEGVLGHSQKCQHCGKKQTQTHIWDEGQSVEDPEHPEVKVTMYTCMVCKATQMTQQPTGEDSVTPSETQPDEETTSPEPEPGNQETTMPNETPSEGPSAGENQDGQGSVNDDHGSDQPSATVPGGDTDHDHEDHPSNTPTIGNDEDHDHVYATIPTSGNDHDHNQVTLPSTESHDHDHDHSSDVPSVSNKEKGRNAWIFFGLLGAMVIAAVVFVKKKR